MFREKIKGAMYDQQVSVKVLSQKTGINASSISSFLNGDRAISNENIEKILDALRLTLVPKKNFVYMGDIKSSGELGN